MGEASSMTPLPRRAPTASCCPSTTSPSPRTYHRCGQTSRCKGSSPLLTECVERRRRQLRAYTFALAAVGSLTYLPLAFSGDGRGGQDGGRPSVAAARQRFADLVVAEREVAVGIACRMVVLANGVLTFV